MFASFALIAAAGLMADGLSMKFIPSDAATRAGGYRPLLAEMDGEAALVKKAPEGLTAPKYGTLKLGDKSWGFILDEPDGKPAKLFVDTNGDGDLTNDPDPKWTAENVGGATMHRGNSQIDLGNNRVGTLGMYRFDPMDPLRAQLKNTMMFYTDFGFEIALDLDGKNFVCFVSGIPESSTSMWIDRDGNKQMSYKREMVAMETPFNFTGTTYVIRLPGGGELKLEKAAETVPMTPLPPNLGVGKKAIPFKMAATDGTQIDFPKTYAGKLVMLDFWATWCGPCIAELPNMKQAHESWHDKGFEILGISFDAPNQDEKLRSFTDSNQMPWPQIYEGKSWETTLGEMYDVSAIPFVLLVDGDTGEILATARELRGRGLSDFIGKALAKKSSTARQ